MSRRYGDPEYFILLLYWNWCSYRLEMGVSGNLWIAVRMPSHLLYMMWNARWLWIQWGEMCFILSWFGVHQSILHSWGDISVHLLLWQCSWGFSSVQSRKSRFLRSLIANTELLSTQCRGIGPHLAASGKSHEFSRVAAGTWCIFSSYGGDGHLKLGFVQRRQDSYVVMMETSGS